MINRKPIIKLWEAMGLGLIIEYPSGIIYSNQTGGTACLHPEFEGVYFPIANDLDNNYKLISPSIDLYEYFTGSKHNGTGATNGLDHEDIIVINKILDKYKLSAFIKVDLNNLAKSHEAWIHVLIEIPKNISEFQLDLFLFEGFGPYPRKGILTWANSD